ncbi:MAG: tetratricopeptide repeat protein, partial [Planctomycetaceae bacterium]
VIASTSVNLAELLRQTGRPQEALSVANRAVEFAEEIYTNQVEPVDANTTLVPAHGCRAHALQALGRYSDAVSDWDRIVAVARNPVRPAHFVSRAYCMVQAKQFHNAAAEAMRLASESQVHPDNLYNVACILCLSAPAMPDTTDASNNDQPTQQQCVETALTLLEQLNQSKYFDDAARAAHVRVDSDLTVLHDEPRFRQLFPATPDAQDVP